MKPEQLARAFEAAAQQLGVRVRRERGTFAGGLCVVEGETVIVLNRRHTADVHAAVLAASLRSLPVDQIYLRPAVRDALEALWETPGVGAPDDPEGADVG